MRKGVLLLMVLLCGCAIRVDKSVHTRAFESAPVPASTVHVYLVGDTLDDECVAVADIHVETEDRSEQLIRRLREEAGKLGANAVQIHSMQAPGVVEELAIGFMEAIGALFGGGPGGGGRGDTDADAVALRCPTIWACGPLASPTLSVSPSARWAS